MRPVDKNDETHARGETVMKRTWVLAIALLLVTAASAAAQGTTTPPPTAPRVGQNFIDANGDGICDNFQSGTRVGQGQGKRYGQGRGDGTGVGPRDGSGFGAGQGAGGGICDGTGPKGKGRGPRR
jgi:hypothetical protein